MRRNDSELDKIPDIPDDDAAFIRALLQQGTVGSIPSYRIQILLSGLSEKAQKVGISGLTSADWGVIAEHPPLQKRLEKVLTNRRRAQTERALGATALASAGYLGAVVQVTGDDNDRTAFHITENRPRPENSSHPKLG